MALYDCATQFASGTLAGCAGTIVSHPFFTLKTHLQNGNKLNTSRPLSALCTTTNAKWLYSGFVPAIIGYSIEKTLVFGVYSNTITYCNLDRHNYLHTAFAGLTSGVTASFSITTFEQLMINKQCNITCAKRQTVHDLYKGLVPTMAREGVGFAIYFTVYEYLSRMYGPAKDDMKKIAAIGCASVICAWTVIFPLDKIKTNIQSNMQVTPHNIKTLYRGFTFALMRAIPFHVTCFVVYEKSQRYLKRPN